MGFFYREIDKNGKTRRQKGDDKTLSKKSRGRKEIEKMDGTGFRPVIS